MQTRGMNIMDVSAMCLLSGYVSSVGNVSIVFWLLSSVGYCVQCQVFFQFQILTLDTYLDTGDELIKCRVLFSVGVRTCIKCRECVQSPGFYQLLGMCVVSVPGVCPVFGVCLVSGYVSRQCQEFVQCRDKYQVSRMCLVSRFYQVSIIRFRVFMCIMLGTSVQSGAGYNSSVEVFDYIKNQGIVNSLNISRVGIRIKSDSVIRFI